MPDRTLNRQVTWLLLSSAVLSVALARGAAGERHASWTATVPRPPASEQRLTAIEQRLLALTNEARQQAHLPLLRTSEVLQQVARAHSANMAKQEKLDHILDGKNPFQRLKEAGYRYRRAGENVATGSPDFTPEQVFAAWMKSPTHRENILHPEYTEIGIGVARSASGDLYYTQVFGKPRAAGN